jgi:hypothetical protein
VLYGIYSLIPLFIHVLLELTFCTRHEFYKYSGAGFVVQNLWVLLPETKIILKQVHANVFVITLVRG